MTKRHPNPLAKDGESTGICITDCIDAAILKCLGNGKADLEIQLGRDDYEALLRIKAAKLGAPESIDTVSAITTYRGYPVRVDYKFASQVLHRFHDGRLTGYAIPRRTK